MVHTADRFTPVRPLGPYLLLVQDQDGMPLVLKRLPDDRANDPEARHEFKLEAWRVAQLRGPRLVRLYSDGSNLAERPFYTMGYAEGPPATLVQPNEVAACVKQLLEALVAIHRHGWVHAALEPAQLRRTEAGIVLVGYGNMTPMGQAARRPGPIGYRSPEHEAGLPLDARADLYSVGALIHFWLTGEMPGELDLLDLVADPLAALGRRLLSRQPADRLPDAQTALIELETKGSGLVRLPQKAPFLLPPTQPRVAAMVPIERLLTNLSNGQGAVRRLEAPPGWGKSTLLSLTAAMSLRNKHAVVRLRGLGPQAWPLSPWREALKTLSAIAQERQGSLLERCRLRLAPLMAPPPNASWPAEAEVSPAPESPLSSELLWRRLCSALLELITGVASPGLVVLLDDWDEADEASRAMLVALVRRLGDAPIVWLVAGAPGRVSELPWPSVEITPFGADELLSLAKAMLPAPAVREGDLTTLAAAAAGQPWFVRTLISLWRDAGEIRVGATSCDIPVPADWPETVSALAWRRGSALDGHAWAVGGAAALLGPLIRPACLEALVPEVEVLATGLDALLRAGILTRVQGGYAFTHPDFATMYARALPPERQVSLHRTLVDAFVDGRLVLDPLSGALHAMRAERPEVAAPLTLAAARQILTLGASETARTILEEGLVMLEAEHPMRGAYLASLGEAHRQADDLSAALTCLREARGVLPPHERVSGLMALARVYAQLNVHEDASLAWREAADTAQSRGDMDGFSLALAGVTDSLNALGRFDAAVESGEAALGGASEAAQLPRAIALLSLGSVLAVGPRERQGEGVALLQQASALFESEGDRPRLVQALLRLGEAEMARGEVQFARQTATRALTLAEELHEVAAMVQAGIQAALVCRALGEGERARELASEARKRAEARQELVGACEAQALEGLLRTGAGDTEAGLALAAEALRRVPATTPPVSLARIQLANVEALLHVGLLPEATQLLQQAASSVKAANRVDWAGRRTYLAGVLAARTGDRERARQDLRAVMAQPNQFLVAQAALQLGQIAIEAGARSEAAGWLEQARRTALSLGAEKLAIDVERVERAMQGLLAQDDESPPAIAKRLETLLTEAQYLLPKVTAPAEEMAALALALREAQVLNGMWPKLLQAQQEQAIAVAIADALFALAPGATRVFVLDQALSPYGARSRGAGEIPFHADQVDTALCISAMESREVREQGAATLAIPLAESPAAPVWGVALVTGEGLEAREILGAVGAAAALVLGRLDA
ncbi:MAG: AAA family ATPase [Candidatus Sericytochromatia bacterium]|nr:AAA family ATPase [Candidatus Sericytochromatia bacterium]